MAPVLRRLCSTHREFFFKVTLMCAVAFTVTFFSELAQINDNSKQNSRPIDAREMYRKPHELKSCESKPKGKGMNLTNQDKFGYLSKVVQEEKHLHDFDFIINQSTKCVNVTKEESNVFLLILITTTHAHFVQRAAIRATWGSLERVFGRHVTVMFFLGRLSVMDRSWESAVRKESAYYGDIVMADFIDTYDNLTLKTISILKWAKLYCPNATYVMKTDDDVFLNIHNLVKFLSHVPTAKQKLVICAKFTGAKPIRDPRNRWYQSKFEFPGRTYPPYCSGSGYVMSGDVAAAAHNVAMCTKHIRLEDVYFGIILQQLGINIQHHKWFLYTEKLYSFCKSWDLLLTRHGVSPSEMKEFWYIVVGKNNNTCQPNNKT